MLPLLFPMCPFSVRGCVMACALYSLSLPSVAQGPETWELLWSDEFDLADGSAPDATNWNYNIGTGNNGWGNAELQYYTDRTENARIENGELVIQVHKEPFGGSDYTSARLLTQNKWDWTYGRFEARIKVPAGAGIWPAFWMLGSDITSVGWPQSGEIDIMEYVGREPFEVFGTIHGPGYSGGAAFGNIITQATPIADDYHIYAVEWEPNIIRWYYDGMLYHTATPADIFPNQWVFDHDFFIILNVAVGGNFGGAVSSRLEFPLQMNVDYVRVYGVEGGIIEEPTVIDVPGRVELEDYTNQFGLRTEITTDTGGGLNLGFLSDGDWGEYTLNVAQAGTYRVDLRYASPNGTSGVTLTTATGVDLSASGFAATGGWQNWSTATLGEIDLPAGEVTLRVTLNVPGDEDLNLNWLELTGVNLAPTWAGYPVDENGFADTGAFLGFVYVGGGPWVWLYAIDAWLYLPETSVQTNGAWGYLVD